MKSFYNILSMILVAATAVGVNLLTGDSDAALAVVPASIVLTDPMRAAYNRLLNVLENQFGMDLDEATPIISQTDLIMEAPLTDKNSTLQFYPREGDANKDRETEVLLSRREMMFMVSWALQIKQYDESGDYKNGNANKPPFTHPDPNFFNFAGSGKGEAACLETLYDGVLNLMTGNTTRIEDFPTHNFRYAPETQVNHTDAGTAPKTDRWPKYGGSDEERGFIRCNPNNVLDGDDDNVFELYMGAGDRTDIAGENDANKNYARLIIKGFKISSQLVPQGFSEGQY